MSLEVLLIRHAIAEQREIFAATGQSDDLRPLTAKGKKRLHKQTSALTILMPALQRIAYSPLTRAVQTAEIVADYYPTAQLEILPALAPDSYQPLLLNYLYDCHHLHALQQVALVGHEPDLGRTIAWLLSEQTRADWLPLKKGGVALITFNHSIEAGHAQLRWLLTPAQLRLLANAHHQTT